MQRTVLMNTSFEKLKIKYHSSNSLFRTYSSFTIAKKFINKLNKKNFLSFMKVILMNFNLKKIEIFEK